MAIPKIQELYDPILGYLLEVNRDTLVNIRTAMQQYFYVLPDDVHKKEENEQYSLFEWRVNTACNNLYHAGLLLHPQKGIYEISDEGSKVADSNKEVDREYLWNIPEFRRYSRSKRDTKTDFNDKYEDLEKIGRKEYAEIKDVTVEKILELKEQDTRFANMMATGLFMLADGQIESVPIDVLQNDISLKEHRATTLSHSASNKAFDCKAQVNGSGKVKAVRRRNAIPGGIGSRPRKWENPDPFVNNTINNDYSKLQHYKGLKSIREAMAELILNDYKISYAELHRRTGISEDKLRNMCTDDTYNPKFIDLVAILIKLKVPVFVSEYILSLAGFPPSADKYKKHFELIEIAKYYSAPEINDLCVNLGIDKIFPATILD